MNQLPNKNKRIRGSKSAASNKNEICRLSHKQGQKQHKNRHFERLHFIQSKSAFQSKNPNRFSIQKPFPSQIQPHFKHSHLTKFSKLERVRRKEQLRRERRRRSSQQLQLIFFKVINQNPKHELDIQPYRTHRHKQACYYSFLPPKTIEIR